MDSTIRFCSLYAIPFLQHDINQASSVFVYAELLWVDGITIIIYNFVVQKYVFICTHMCKVDKC